MQNMSYTIFYIPFYSPVKGWHKKYRPLSQLVFLQIRTPLILFFVYVLVIMCLLATLFHLHKSFRYEREPEDSVNMKVCTVLHYKVQRKRNIYET